jgi:hypothetical protein
MKTCEGGRDQGRARVDHAAKGEAKGEAKAKQQPKEENKGRRLPPLDQSTTRRVQAMRDDATKRLVANACNSCQKGNKCVIT